MVNGKAQGSGLGALRECPQAQPLRSRLDTRRRPVYKRKAEIGNSRVEINPHEVENARVSRERGSDLLGPEFCAGDHEVHGEA